jgi:hypothetical protein
MEVPYASESVRATSESATSAKSSVTAPDEVRADLEIVFGVLTERATEDEAPASDEDNNNIKREIPKILRSIRFS